MPCDACFEGNHFNCDRRSVVGPIVRLTTCDCDTCAQIGEDALQDQFSKMMNKED